MGSTGGASAAEPRAESGGSDDEDEDGFMETMVTFRPRASAAEPVFRILEGGVAVTAAGKVSGPAFGRFIEHNFDELAPPPDSKILLLAGAHGEYGAPERLAHADDILFGEFSRSVDDLNDTLGHRRKVAFDIVDVRRYVSPVEERLADGDGLALAVNELEPTVVAHGICYSHGGAIDTWLKEGGVYRQCIL